MSRVGTLAIARDEETVMNDERILEFFRGMIRRFQTLALWLILLLVAALLVVTIGLRSSLGRFEDELHYRPPQSTVGIGEPLAENVAVAQTVYVPVYSHVYVHDGKPYPLTATLRRRTEIK